jgi:hypothetical protein
MPGKSARIVIIGAALSLAGALAACGGGGGGSSGGGGVPATATPTPTPTATPLVVQGSVRDLGTQRYAGDGGAAGAVITSATIVVGPTLIVGATPPPTLPSGDAKATTASDGSYTVTGYTAGSPTYVMVFPAAGDPHVSLHALAKISGGAIRTLYLYAPSATETGELTQINADRSSNGAAPVVFDEIGFETARAHADFMAANGYYAHCIPMSNCAPGIGTPPATFAPQYASPNDLYNYLGGALQLTPASNSTENIVANEASWSAADAWFMAEKGTPNHGHFDQIVFPSHNWVGLGDNQAPKPPASFGLYLQEFY